MRLKTSVRQPVIAGARRRHLSDLLRKWRRQPRQRSPLLFWSLLAFALLSDAGLLALGMRLFGGVERWFPPLAFVEQWFALPAGTAGDFWVWLQTLLLLSAYAALALAWGAAVVTLGRIIVAPLTGARVRKQADFCLHSIRIGVVLLTANTLLAGCRELDMIGTLDHSHSPWPGWNAQAMGTLLVLPGCIALLYARGRGRLQPFAVLAGTVCGFTLLTVPGNAAGWAKLEDHTIVAAVVAFLHFSLAAHAALRYYFGKQRILDI